MQNPFPWTDRFERLELLGRGSQSEVYRVHDRKLGIDVALKCIGGVSARSIADLKAEFRTAAELSHPNLVALHELFVGDGTAAISMELVRGSDFLEAVSARGGESGIAGLARQLCHALATLHAAGLVHRDVKPRNILVRPDGSLVLLDFGFLRDARELPAAPREKDGLVGTIAYMAPELFYGSAGGAAADTYAVGVVLHEEISGALPEPLLLGDARTTAASLPAIADPILRSLVEAMLSVNPAERPAMKEAGLILDGEISARQPSPSESPFVGRSAEQELLLQALTAPGDGSMIELLGQSGVGKTELVRRVLSALANTEALVLRSRCRRSETLSFQAFDELIDGLGLALLERGTAGDAELVAVAESASILFPQLTRLPMVRRRSLSADDDPIELRREGVAALRRLLHVACGSRRLVLWIDDAQWADIDSISLLHELMDSEAALAFRWVLTTRSPDSQPSSLAAAYASLSGNGNRYRAVSLEPLSADESATLVRTVSPLSALPEETLRAILRAGAGYPMVLASLAALEEVVEGAALAGGFSFVLARSTEDLRTEERRLLELVAVSRRPTDLQLLLEASGAGSAGALTIRKLEARRLVRTAPRGEGVFVDSYHDQVPDTLLAELPAQALRECHHQLAIVHEQHHSDPSILSLHFHGAGELHTAAGYAETAGHQAEQALAFARAAELFRSARIWDDRATPDRVAALLQLEGRSLANAGSLADAGDRYLEASRQMTALPALEVRRQAVESLLAGGRINDALGELQELLAQLGMRYPRSEASALARAVGSLVWYLVRARQRYAGPPQPLELLRIDTAYSAGRRLADIDPSRGSYLLAASLSRALRGGDPQRLARSLCTAGGALGAVGGRVIHRIGDRMMSEAAAIADDLGTDELCAMIDVAYGEIHMLDGRWNDALSRSRAGVGQLQQKPGYVFECNVARAVVLRALEELGRVGEEYSEARSFLEAAAAHHNSYAEIRAAQHLTVACLALDRGAEARSYLAVGFDRWMDGAFQMQHLYAARNEALCDLYDGDPEHGWEVLARIEDRYRRSVLRQVPLIRIDMNTLRGQLALAMAARGNTRQLRSAERAERMLRREGRSDATLRSLLLRSGLERAADAVNTLDQAERLARDLGMELIESAAMLRRAQWSGKDTDVSRAIDRLSASGVGQPERYATALIPSSTEK